MPDTLTEPVRGPRLPRWEVDTAGWIASTLAGHPDSIRHNVSAEVLTDGAVLLRFPSGGERHLYVDDRPHGESFHVTRERLEEEAAEVVSLRAELEDAEAESKQADEAIEEARALLLRLANDDRMADLPDWLLDKVEEIEDVLNV
jgi:hypothetical protein